MKNLIHNHSPPLFVLIQKIDTEGLYLLVLVNMFNHIFLKKNGK